jgi:hypothetical protein
MVVPWVTWWDLQLALQLVPRLVRLSVRPMATQLVRLLVLASFHRRLHHHHRRHRHLRLLSVLAWVSGLVP